MTPDELKSCVRGLVKTYFAGATVYWAEERGVKAALPLVTLKLSSLSRARFAMEHEDKGELVKCFPSEATLEVNLYTRGWMAPQEAGKVSARGNTALSDLSEFVSFLSSNYALAFLEENDLELAPAGPLRDVTALLGGSQYEFRAMQEFTVCFIQEAREWSGIAPPPEAKWRQTDSGGGTEELAQFKTGWANEAEINRTNEVEINKGDQADEPIK